MRVMINRSVAKGLVCGLARAGDVAIGGDRDAADNLAARRFCVLFATALDAGRDEPWPSLCDRESQPLASLARHDLLGRRHAWIFSPRLRPIVFECIECRATAEAQPGYRSGLQEGQQVSVDRFGLGGRHAVRESFVCLQRPVLH